LSKKIEASLHLMSDRQCLMPSEGLLIDVATLIVAVFRAVEDRLEGEQPLRRSGWKSKPSDSEILTIESARELYQVRLNRLGYHAASGHQW
jgi:hypothetical protein